METSQSGYMEVGYFQPNIKEDTDYTLTPELEELFVNSNTFIMEKSLLYIELLRTIYLLNTVEGLDLQLDMSDIEGLILNAVNEESSIMEIAVRIDNVFREIAVGIFRKSLISIEKDMEISTLRDLLKSFYTLYGIAEGMEHPLVNLAYGYDGENKVDNVSIFVSMITYYSDITSSPIELYDVIESVNDKFFIDYISYNENRSKDEVIDSSLDKTLKIASRLSRDYNLFQSFFKSYFMEKVMEEKKYDLSLTEYVDMLGDIYEGDSSNEIYKLQDVVRAVLLSKDCSKLPYTDINALEDILRKSGVIIKLNVNAIIFINQVKTMLLEMRTVQ